MIFIINVLRSGQSDYMRLKLMCLTLILLASVLSKSN